MEDRVVLFDGVCNLCDKSVQVLLRLDKGNILKFTSLQSEFGQNLLKKTDLNSKNFNTFYYLRNGKVLDKSDAALYILYDLKKMWQLLFTFILVPKVIRDFIYSFIAKHRYKVFGKKDSCLVPSKEYQNKFLK